ncbi:hypothetical protein NDU88_006309 [Pleurodeles waltl]|uniref:Uncharacterized protein n=1 Tax=Pleurodeles waltl TaxID=8319 RepID=A0AAV7VPG1_PLEWA|nr:hypothetical protein NDU88_006309 [Pleurodeles waltl]
MWGSGELGDAYWFSQKYIAGQVVAAPGDQIEDGIANTGKAAGFRAGADLNARGGDNPKLAEPQILFLNYGSGWKQLRVR